MILMSGESFNRYLSTVDVRLNVTLSMMKLTVESEVYRQLFFGDDSPLTGRINKALQYGTPSKFPCLIRTVISFKKTFQSYNDDRVVVYTPTYSHIVVSKSQAKLLVYPKSRLKWIPGMQLLNSIDELSYAINRLQKVGHDPDCTNSKEVMTRAQDGLFKFPVFFMSKNYCGSIKYNEEDGRHFLDSGHNVYFVVDSKEAHSLIYCNKKGGRNGIKKLAKKYTEVRFQGIND